MPRRKRNARRHLPPAPGPQDVLYLVLTPCRDPLCFCQPGSTTERIRSMTLNSERPRPSTAEVVSASPQVVTEGARRAHHRTQ